MNERPVGWSPPSSAPTDPDRLPALNGSLLFSAGRKASEVTDFLRFLSPPVPAMLEIGFDHGMCLVDRARTFPDTLQVGLEIREARVTRLRPHLPGTAFAWRADARTVLASVVPPGRFSGIYVLFPDPVWVESRRRSHLLFSPAFVALCARALAPDGFLHVVTDVEPYHTWIRSLLTAWTPSPDPPLGTEISRRERVCRRDGLMITRGTWTRPA